MTTSLPIITNKVPTLVGNHHVTLGHSSRTQVTLGIIQINNSFHNQSYLPLSAGFLIAYANKHVKNIGNFKFLPPVYKRMSVDLIIDQVKDADLVAFSVYVWNYKISCLVAEKLKILNPGVIILFGGCHVPDDAKVLEKFLRDLPFVDFACSGEGEVAFASFLDNFHARNWSQVPSLSYLSGGNFVKNPMAPRINDLNDIPSPFLTGIFDRIIEDNPEEGWIGLWETNRGCPFKCTFCFSGDTILLLKDRVVRFNQEKYIENFICEGGHDHLKVGSQDKSLVYQGLKNCIKIGISNGSSLTLTPDHQIFYVEHDSISTKEVGKLLVGEWLMVQTGQNSISEKVKISVDGISNKMLGKVPDVLDEDLAWMTGLLIGDGNLRKNGGSVRFVASPEIEEKIINFSEKVFRITPHSYSIGNTDKVKHVEIISKLAVKTFESLGVLRGKDKLRVPNLILRSPISVVRGFLHGLWDADGYNPKSVTPPYLTTVSHRLAEEVCSLIHWIGDISQIRHIDSKKYKPNVLYNVQSVYRVEWHSRDMREKDNLRGPCGISNQIPLTFGIAPDLQVTQSVGKNGRTRGVVSRNRLRRFDKNHLLLDDDDVVFVQVTSIADVGELEVYDIMNQPNSQVAANGILAHNCDWGVGAKKRMADYNLDRLFQEIDWFSKNRIEFIYCCDANFGMYKDRDLAITNKFAENKKKFGYPEALSVQNTKNSTEASYNIQKIMTQNDLSKGVLLAFQSLHEPSLKAIKRDNIKLETFYDLQRRFTSEGVKTFSDIILGLPEETYETFVQGVSTLIEMGQHNRIQFNNLSILPNAEMGDEEYQKKYGLEIVTTKQINIHGSLGEWVDNIYETQELVIATSSMSREDWVKCRSFAFMVALMHFDKLLQIPLILMNSVYGVRYREVIEAALKASTPVLSQVSSFFSEKARDIQSGGEEYCESEDWLGIFWPADEFLFIKLVREGMLDQFYSETLQLMMGFLNNTEHQGCQQVLLEAVSFNKKMIKVPFVNTNINVELNYNIWDVYRSALIGEKIQLEKGTYKYVIDRSSYQWDCWDDWFRKVVWYGNKKGAYLYQIV